MNEKRYFIALILSFMLVGAPIADAASGDDHGDASGSDRDAPTLIAHAGGAFDGWVGQNSREALDANYAKGHRYFEIDFCWTSDDRLVLIHDWETAFNRLFEDADERPTFERFESMTMKRGMTQMSLESLLAWMSKHRDAHIVTDVKERNIPALKRIAKSAGKLQRRFISQVYAPAEFESVGRLGFKRVILTLYRLPLPDADVIRFAVDNDPFAITLSTRRAFSFSSLRELSRTGVPIYTHTINKIEIFNYFRGEGVHGIYTDAIAPEDLHP